MKAYQFFTERHHLTDEGVALYVDALRLDRTSELPPEVRIHVEGCEGCQRHIVESHDMMRGIPVDRTAPHPYFDRQDRESMVQEPAARYTVYRIAAAVAGIALLVAGYYAVALRDTAPPAYTEKEQNRSVQQTEPNQSHTAPADNSTEPLLADNFVESPNMEDLVETGFRSTTVDVISPLNGDVVTVPIRFRWKASEENMTLKILTNQERTVLSQAVTGDAFTVQRKLAPGLYYWKLETKKELVHAGKFLVR